MPFFSLTWIEEIFEKFKLRNSKVLILHSKE
jgi:hypothetical protein